jgi:hypothetical protein
VKNDPRAFEGKPTVALYANGFSFVKRIMGIGHSPVQKAFVIGLVVFVYFKADRRHILIKMGEIGSEVV